MSRYRLLPAPAQEAVLRDHCGHARYVWNLAVEQHAHWHPGRKRAPGYLEQCRQLTAARAEHPWLAAGGQTVQQQALRDFTQAMAAFFDPGNPAGRPSWRKAGRHEGFRITGRRGRQWDVRRVSRHVGQIWVPKAGWVSFRWSRAVPEGAKSYRVTQDRAGGWHVAFAVIPAPVPAPGNGQVVGIDRGVAVVRGPVHRGDAALPRPDRAGAEAAAAAGAQARPREAGLEPPRPGQARGRPAAGPRDGPAQGLGREGLHGHRAPLRCDPGRGPAGHEHDPSAKGTRENPGRNVRQKAGLNRGILGSGWGLLVRRLQDKAPGRVEKVRPAFTSQRCSACGQVDARSRESQPRFVCTACGFAWNADVNAAINIAAGHAVTARGGDGAARPVNREPHLLLQTA